MPECEPWPAQEQLRHEKDALGFFLTAHPLDRFRDLIAAMCTASSRAVREAEGSERAVFGGIVTAIKATTDRSGRAMAFVTLEDGEGQAEVLLFADVYERARHLLAVDGVLVVEGRLSKRNGEGKVLAQSVVSLGDGELPELKEVHLTLDLETVGDAKLHDLKSLLTGRDGQSRVYFHLREGGRRACVIRSKSCGVKLDHDLVSSLSASIGARNVRVVPASMGP
jgi:DNA polymerase-3 subunit alpha